MSLPDGLEVSIGSVAERSDTPAAVLAPQYYRHSHLPGALNLPPGKVSEMAPDLLPNKAAEMVLYCWDAA